MSFQSFKRWLLQPRIIAAFLILGIVGGVGIWYQVSKSAAAARGHERYQNIALAQRMYGVGRILVVLSTVQKDFDWADAPGGDDIKQPYWIPHDAQSVQNLKQAMDEYNKTVASQKKVEADGFIKLVSLEGLREFVNADKDIGESNYYDFAVWCKEEVDLVTRSNGETYVAQTSRHMVSQYEYYSDTQLQAQCELRSQWNAEHPDNQK